MHNNCNFSLWSPISGGIEDIAFSCYAQACEGDFTVGHRALDQVAESLGYNWVYLRVNPNDMTTVRDTCQRLGVNYDSLLSEEVDYLSRKTEEVIRKYGAVQAEYLFFTK